MSTVTITLPDDLQDLAAAQAEAAGMTLDQYVATVLACTRRRASRSRTFLCRPGRPGRARPTPRHPGPRRAGQPALARR